jgi:hypothetical protein
MKPSAEFVLVPIIVFPKRKSSRNFVAGMFSKDGTCQNIKTIMLCHCCYIMTTSLRDQHELILARRNVNYGCKCNTSLWKNWFCGSGLRPLFQAPTTPSKRHQQIPERPPTTRDTLESSGFSPGVSRRELWELEKVGKASFFQRAPDQQS